VIAFGPQVISLITALAKQHLAATLLAIAGIVLLGVIFWRLRQKKSAAMEPTEA
jgi:hypothetical protein